MTDCGPPPSRLLVRYAQGHPAEFALAVAGADGPALSALLASLPKSVLSAVVAHLPKGVAEELLDRSSDSELVQWLSEADLQSAVRLARRLNPSRRADLADGLPVGRRRDLERCCAFPDASVGAWADAGRASPS